MAAAGRREIPRRTIGGGIRRCQTNELEKLPNVRQVISARMARWERLYHERIASFFPPSLYWRRFAAYSENSANSCFLTATEAGLSTANQQQGYSEEPEASEKRPRTGLPERGRSKTVSGSGTAPQPSGVVRAA